MGLVMDLKISRRSTIGESAALVTIFNKPPRPAGDDPLSSSHRNRLSLSLPYRDQLSFTGVTLSQVVWERPGLVKPRLPISIQMYEDLIAVPPGGFGDGFKRAGGNVY